MTKLFLLLAFTTTVSCTLTVNKLENEFNKDVIVVAYNFSNEAHQDSVINMEAETFANVCDVEKLLTGLSGNFIAKALIESIRKSVDFELKFPFKKGIYRYNNMTVSDKYLPLVKPKFLIDIKSDGTVDENKTVVFFYRSKWFCELK